MASAASSWSSPFLQGWRKVPFSLVFPYFWLHPDFMNSELILLFSPSVSRPTSNRLQKVTRSHGHSNNHLNYISRTDGVDRLRDLLLQHALLISRAGVSLSMAPPALLQERGEAGSRWLVTKDSCMNFLLSSCPSLKDLKVKCGCHSNVRRTLFISGNYLTPLVVRSPRSNSCHWCSGPVMA